MRSVLIPYYVGYVNMRWPSAMVISFRPNICRGYTGCVSKNIYLMGDRKFGDGVPAQVSSSSSDHGSEIQ
ncbi:hypothetical protein AVEN_68069-1, partial [Araneus ventricosus]